ncbi:hypothetical protein CHU92_03345 [Flavobacterium cyanobacteriorum]|uniref:Entericidin n=1 Tax=Flavobacterium cyanobacteriorum TaxID=2022802 RepID=A0A255ZPJ7_9FLAO|nr:hypothetical protein [Flavobacterium cyanobacteriorum]OYQ43507.1 hypothetical protein CHU92_03345 [Flavobacterium cyanobacteriorum]
MKKFLNNAAHLLVAVVALSATSCRDTNPGNKDGDADMGMTTDSIFTQTDTIDNNKSTKDADTELDGE